MRRLLITLLLTASLAGSASWAAVQQHTDTLTTRQGTKVILRYSVKYDGARATVKFDRPIFWRMGKEHQSYKDKKDKLLVWMFDERKSSYGGKKEDIEFKGHYPPSIISTRNVTYNRDAYNHDDGFVSFYDDTELEFTLPARGSPSVELPLYMVYYKSKNKHKIVDKFSHNLSIDLSKPASNQAQGQRQGSAITQQQQQGNSQGAGGHWVEEEVREEQLVPELTPGDGATANVRALIDKAKAAMQLSGDELSPEAANAIIELAGMRNMATDEEKAEIDQLNALMLEKKGAAAAAAAAAKAEQEAKAQAAEEKAKEEQEASKKRTLWMVVGGGLLAVLLFVGNQVMQSLRNKAQVRSMQELQDRALNQAGNKVSQTAQRGVNQKVNQIEDAVKNAVRSKANANPIRANANENAVQAKVNQANANPVRPKVDRSKESLQDKAQRAARGARISKNRDRDGKISI
ncbi:MAG: hypothetical protein J6S96_09285 [Muribaculaceae bacterium]|nr:hypothetical protein [Muribaculaceae bacterium]